jgi:type IV pilus assembly protein PilA
MPRNGERGFTLIELLVVILIIAILAAIALPVFLNQRAKAQDADAKSAASVASRAIEIYHQDHDTYASADPAALVAVEASLGQAQNLTVSGTRDSYKLEVDSKSGDGPFRVEHDPTGMTRTCDHPGRGGCPADGEW